MQGKLNYSFMFLLVDKIVLIYYSARVGAGSTKGGSITVLLTSCLSGFEISCMTTDNFCFYLQNRLIQTSQTRGQQYSDTSPFSIPWLVSVGTIGAFKCFFSITACHLRHLAHQDNSQFTTLHFLSNLQISLTVL